MYSPSIQKLIDLFSKFPTIGPRTAARFVFYLMKLPKEEIEDLIKSISTLKEKVKLCSFCFGPFEPARQSPEGSRPTSPASELAGGRARPMAGGSENDFCEICQNSGRDKTLLCVIEKETDLIPIEKTKKYKGLYFILGGSISAFKEENNKKLRANELLERVKNSEIQEIIIATNSTTEGEATALYLERILKPLNKKNTRLGRGLPVGSELEYADEETLSSALERRR